MSYGHKNPPFPRWNWYVDTFEEYKKYPKTIAASYGTYSWQL
jgi:hypothetical protein